MRYKKSLFLIIGFIIICSCAGEEKIPDKITFFYQMDEAFKAAAEKSQPLVVEFYKPDCPHSKMLDDSTFNNKIVISMSNDMVFAKINTAQDTIAAERYGVSFYPTIIVFQSGGEEVDRLVGYYPPADFFNEVQLYLQGNETLKDYHIRLSDESERVDYHLIIGEKYKHRAEWDKALEYYNNVLKLADDENMYELEKAMIGVADVLCEQENFESAVIAYSDFIDKFPESENTEDAVRKAAYCLAQAGHLEEASERFREYLAKYPNGAYYDWAEDKLRELERFSRTDN